MSSAKSTKQIILNAADDLMTDFLVYDRKEDEDLPREVIEEAIRTGDITINEIVKLFHSRIDEAATQYMVRRSLR